MEWHYNNVYPPELYHYGILGQRWGIRRFQNPDGTLTEAGRKRYRVDTEGNIVAKTKKEIKEDAKQAKKEKLEKQKQTRLEREHETLEKKKARIVKSRDPELVYKNRDMFDIQELTALYNIMNAENNIKKLAMDKAKEQRGKTFTEKMAKINKFINTGADTINAGANFAGAIKKFYKLFEQPSGYDKAASRAKKDAEYYKNWFLSEQNKKNLKDLGIDLHAENYIYTNKNRTYPTKQT